MKPWCHLLGPPGLKKQPNLGRSPSRPLGQGDSSRTGADLAPGQRPAQDTRLTSRAARGAGAWAPFPKGPSGKTAPGCPSWKHHSRYRRREAQTQAGIQRAWWRDSSGSRQGPERPRGPQAGEATAAAVSGAQSSLSGHGATVTVRWQCGPWHPAGGRVGTESSGHSQEGTPWAWEGRLPTTLELDAPRRPGHIGTGAAGVGEAGGGWGRLREGARTGEGHTDWARAPRGPAAAA